MKDYFLEVAAGVEQMTRSDEVVLSWFAAEESDFLRFNVGAVRQSLAVRQLVWTLSLFHDRRRTEASVTLTGHARADLAALEALLGRLRSGLADVPEEPHFLYEHRVTSSSQETEGSLPELGEVLDAVLSSKGLDLVGAYAGGPIYRGFANTLGARHWRAVPAFNLSWCLYGETPVAMKSSYAGSTWNRGLVEAKMGFAREGLASLNEPPRQLTPGNYRAFLAPEALAEIFAALAWGGFGLESRLSKRSALLRMIEGDASLSRLVTLKENARDGLACAFQREGFVRPDAITLIDAGQLAAPLVSPRSAQEFGVETNGANRDELPEALDLEPGDLAERDAMAALGTGVYVSNLWYLNYSDFSACRLTGLTRFASFWVENGRAVAPLEVTRFDDTAYRFLGENLEALTIERHLIVDDSAYGERSTSSMRAPGALLRAMSFTASARSS